jgi:hypothetical protein
MRFVLGVVGAAFGFLVGVWVVGVLFAIFASIGDPLNGILFVVTAAVALVGTPIASAVFFVRWGKPRE